MPVVWEEGTITADGTEQTLIEVTTTYNVDGFIDLSQMEAGDKVIIRLYGRIKSGGDYRLYEEAEFSGVQAKPLVYVHRRPTRYGWKVTLQQTEGTYKSFDYQFAKTPV